MSVRTLTQIEADNNWAQVICGHWHTIALKTNGTLWRLGANTFDLRKAEKNRTFTQIESDNDWVDISCGQNHLVAIKTDGTLWGLGYNNYGQLAGDRTVYRSFTQIGASNNWAHVTCGRQCTLVIDMQGTLWECGGFDNERRKLVPINPKPNWVRSIDTEEYRLAIDPQGGVFVEIKDEEEGEEGDE
jgi:alpha-tubulin suppressor-like RCC1 family protein